MFKKCMCLSNDDYKSISSGETAYSMVGRDKGGVGINDI